jgi:hypothetical protein
LSDLGRKEQKNKRRKERPGKNYRRWVGFKIFRSVFEAARAARTATALRGARTPSDERCKPCSIEE